MFLSLELNAETQARLAAEAQARGLSLQAYVQGVVEQAAWNPAQRADEIEQRRQAVRDMLEFTQKHHFTLGDDLNIKDLIHESHKY